MDKTFRQNPALNIETTLMDLAVGEALVSFLDEKGSPTVVERAFICPPRSRAGAITPDERSQIIKESIHFGNYERVVDRESAYEVLTKRTQEKLSQENQRAAQEAALKNQPQQRPSYPDALPARRGRPADNLMTTVAKSAARTVGSQVGRQIIRGVLGSIFGGRR
jgi:hypothetical protein